MDYNNARLQPFIMEIIKIEEWGYDEAFKKDEEFYVVKKSETRPVIVGFRFVRW